MACRPSRFERFFFWLGAVEDEDGSTLKVFAGGVGFDNAVVGVTGRLASDAACSAGVGVGAFCCFGRPGLEAAVCVSKVARGLCFLPGLNLDFVLGSEPDWVVEHPQALHVQTI